MSTLFAVVVGGVIAFASAVGVKLWDDWRFRKNLRAAFRAGIETVLELAELRKYEGHFREHLEAWKRGDHLDRWPTIIGYKDAPKHPIVEANVGNIGRLGNDVAADVVRFYVLLQGIETDITAAARGELDRFTQQERINLIEQDLTLWDQVRQLGDSLLEKLHAS